MKFFFKYIVFTSIGLYLVNLVVAGFTIEGGLKTFLTASLVLGILNMTVRPLVNLLLLPINLLTLGMFRWVVNVLTLWLVSVFVGQFSITSFVFPGFVFRGFAVPELLISAFWTSVLGAFLLSVFTGVLDWLAQ